MKCSRPWCKREASRFKLCATCRENARAQHAKYRQRHREASAAAQKRYRDAKLADGMCSMCLVKPTVSETSCAECLRYRRERYLARTEGRQRRACVCGSTDHGAGSRLCPVRYAVDREEIAAARAPWL
jgi:hypothetical protein